MLIKIETSGVEVLYSIYFDYKNCKGIVYDEKEVNELENKWFGNREGNVLTLDIVEIAYLLLNNKIKVLGNNNTAITDLDSFLSTYYKCVENFFWPKLIVYRDLRNRGRKVKVFGENKFLMKDKHGDLKLVVVLEEGMRHSVVDIYRNIDSSRSNNLKLVYAIVSLQGDLTYYELNKIEPVRD